MKNYSPSANIESGVTGNEKYIITPNVQKVAGEIVNQYQAGIHSFTIIGTYGTGKSCFLLKLERDLIGFDSEAALIKNLRVLAPVSGVDILNIIGEYSSLERLIIDKLNKKANGDTAIELLKNYYNRLKRQNKMLVIVIDEFGKLLEHAAKNEVEKELYFVQQLAEFVNMPERNILLLTTLHQNFSSYASKLSSVQKNEWTKVKGRFQEVVFAEPVEQLLYMAAESLNNEVINADMQVSSIYAMALKCKLIVPTLKEETIRKLFPLDAFSAVILTKAIQKYGQNERSLFSFLNANGSHALNSFEPTPTCTYNLSIVYDYLVAYFHSYLSDANADSMGWRAILVAIERVETADWKTTQLMEEAIKTIKAIGLLNIFGGAGFSMSKNELVDYMKQAMSIDFAENLLDELIRRRIIRYAEYKSRFILFEGTDVNIEDEIIKASTIVSIPTNPVDSLRDILGNHIVPVKAYYYYSGTPRYFEYLLSESPLDLIPVGEVDGFIELIFSTNENTTDEVRKFSANCEYARVFAVFNNTESFILHLHKIQIYDYIIQKTLIDKTDHIALREINNLKSYEHNLLKKELKESLFSYNGHVVWFYKGEEKIIKNQRDFNSLLSYVCKDVYPLSPVISNELINRHKLSGSISAARIKYLQALIGESEKDDFGWDKEKCPPEKSIYYTLLKTTGLHKGGEFAEEPTVDSIMPLWNACESFLRSTQDKSRKISELIKMLSEKPYKVKMGVLDFWIPTYLYMKRLDYSLFGSNGMYIPEVNMEFFDLLKKHPSDFSIKAYTEDGVKIKFYNQYRRFINVSEDEKIKGDKFIETIKPFFSFYSRLNDYAKYTRKFDNITTLRFRDVLAKAKDPEKTFFEDLPEALGYDKKSLDNEVFVKNYCNLIQKAVRELRSCYNALIDRIEGQLIERLELQRYEYSDYIIEIRHRLSHIKEHLLSDKQHDFYNHVMTVFDNRQEWFQSIAYAALDQPLERLKDDQEEQLIDNIVYLFRECEKHSIVSEAMSFQVNAEERKRSKELETKIEKLLSEDVNLNIYALMNLLKKKMK